MKILLVFAFVTLTMVACSGGKTTLKGSSVVRGPNLGGTDVNACSTPLAATILAKPPFNGGSFTEGQDVVFEIAISGGCGDTYRIVKDAVVITQTPATSPTVYVVNRGGYTTGGIEVQKTDSFKIEVLKAGIVFGLPIQVTSAPFTVVPKAPTAFTCAAALNPNRVNIMRNAQGQLAFPAVTQLQVTGMINGMASPIVVQQILVGNTPMTVPPANVAGTLPFVISTPNEGAIAISVFVKDANSTATSLCSDLFTVIGVAQATPAVDLRLSLPNANPVDGVLALAQGQAFDLVYAVQNANSCYIVPGNIAAPGSVGRIAMPAPTAGQVYTLGCLGQNNVPVLDTAEVKVAWIDLKVANSGLPPVSTTLVSRFNSAIRVSWSSAGAVSCIAAVNGFQFASGVSGTNVATPPLTARSQVSLTCQIPGSPLAMARAIEIQPYWYQLDQEEERDDRKPCSEVCNRYGRTNTPSPENHYCMSGEVRPQSGIGVISQLEGCFGNCAQTTNRALSRSDGRFCYEPATPGRNAQKKDNDRTDRTMGCFCT